MRPTSSASYQYLVANGYGSSNYGALYFNGNQLEYWQGGSLKVSSPAIPLNTFTHVALTYDGSVDRLYINSALGGTSSAHAETFNNPIVLGSAFTPVGADKYFTGQLDEVSLYNRALSLSEIQSIFNAVPGQIGQSAPTTPTPGGGQAPPIPSPR